MNRQKILIVDDSEMNREILKAILGEGYKYTEAEDGAQALRMLRQDMNIDLMLLDINMPKVDGFTVLEYMNQFRWIDEIPVVMISAADDHESIERCYSLGVSDYIRRPFDSFIVQRRVKNTLTLYANQKRLMGMVSNQIYRNQRDNNVMIGILSHIVEFRNSESAQHVLQVQTVTGMLLRRLSEKTDVYHLTEEKIRLIVTASALHDIGKISIPESILNKPGRLTPEEFDVIRTHPAIGASMLEGLTPYRKEPLLKAAIEICRWHHERWDGGGYPDGLLGEQIPISAQVVALADVYDALTSDRCYKKAYSHETAVTMILNGECGAFNPMLLDCLQEISARLKSSLPRLAAEWSMKKDAQRLSSELLKKNELPRSDRAQRELNHAREMLTFFASCCGGVQFEYDALPVDHRGRLEPPVAEEPDDPGRGQPGQYAPAPAGRPRAAPVRPQGHDAREQRAFHQPAPAGRGRAALAQHPDAHALVAALARQLCRRDRLHDRHAEGAGQPRAPRLRGQEHGERAVARRRDPAPRHRL